jgi:tyrosyl-tRNA synthetase
MSNIVLTDELLIEEVVSRSIDKIYPSKLALKKALKSGKQLTFYVGIDPTADYVHLGHSTNYLILERLHKLGHRIIVLVGDFTAMIGDPSDKTSMRIQLTKDEVEANLKTFKDQIGKILDFDNKTNPIEFKFNSKWLSSLTFKDTVELASNFSVQQMLERDSFQKRINQKKPLFVHEFFYPLMQGYDSVAMNVDAEIGGTDQTFNMLAGRTLLKRYKNKEKFVITTTLLVNPITGEKLMSKSLGTGVALNEEPSIMFIKIMELADEGIMQCFIDCTRLPMSQIEEISKSLAEWSNPRDIKIDLAHEIVKMYHGGELADKAKEQWINTVSKKIITKDLDTISLNNKIDIVDELVKLKIVGSKNNARRLFTEGAIRIDGKKVDVINFHKIIHNNAVLSIGKKKQFLVTIK